MACEPDSPDFRRDSGGEAPLTSTSGDLAWTMCCRMVATGSRLSARSDDMFATVFTTAWDTSKTLPSPTDTLVQKKSTKLLHSLKEEGWCILG